jgi:hypothetical protein
MVHLGDTLLIELLKSNSRYKSQSGIDIAD